jgi:oxaloacetate decarboxylase gamma subunit
VFIGFTNLQVARQSDGFCYHRMNKYLNLSVFYFDTGFEGKLMDIGAVLATAGNLMLTGMIGVFVFLSVLIGAVKLMSNIVSRFEEPEPDAPAYTPSVQAKGVPNGHIAAISAAIAQYKSNNK